ncbi:hypothetical protein [Chitinophaga pinensis]|uniref:Uncharacterized protein n=1 Tax=Chitinophaga pinensis (strain ATCC 43595 / DSM 2588 / LMG 13176 / NBRC 15968 / NCIMB 11800 / UQM 2034) TaxID=485918 RepID=A0A979GQR4_CHIPD|nr:hypothetical protein [Chitinophaga pinensis]ACU61762.1 hypothetical protein Cpin_4314 [Chitinophaga pinensis DSM 2588]
MLIFLVNQLLRLCQSSANPVFQIKGCENHYAADGLDIFNLMSAAGKSINLEEGTMYGKSITL